jgi:uncharacterized membrane protein YidH (DUF202 family)
MKQNDYLIINEIQLILSEKRTSLSMLRTGIAVFALPLSVLSVLVATSKNYHIMNVLVFILPLFLLCISLIGFACYLVVRSAKKIYHYDRMIDQLKKKSQMLSGIIE